MSKITADEWYHFDEAKGLLRDALRVAGAVFLLYVFSLGLTVWWLVPVFWLAVVLLAYAGLAFAIEAIPFLFHWAKRQVRRFTR